MPGAASVVGVGGAVVVLAVGLVSVGGAALHAQRLAGTADAAALAAADAVSGAVIGVPCDLAAAVVAAGEAALVACEIDGLVATITVGSAYGGIPLDARSRAGPPRP